MADLDLWTEHSKLSNFADDTQSLCVAEDKEAVVTKTKRDASNIINFFSANDLVNNPDKACLAYNSKGKGELLTLEDIGGKTLKSLGENNTEKLLGMQISSDFNWNMHVDKLIIELNKRLAQMRRMKDKIPISKLLMIAEAIFQSKIRYGIALYLNPIFETEDLKSRKLTTEASKIQVIQNNMLRMVFGYRMIDKINMEELRTKIGMFSVNQLNCYHVLLEAFNVINYGSSETIQSKWMPKEQKHYSNRRQHDVQVPRVNHVKSQGFTYHAAKFWNKLPENIKEITNPDIFKARIKNFIWQNIPSY